MIPSQPKIFAFVYPDFRKDVYDGLKYFQRLKPLYFFSELSHQYDFGDEVKPGVGSITCLGYRGRLDLFKKLMREDPDVIMCPEPYFRPWSESLVSLVFSVLFRKCLCFMQSGTATAESLFGSRGSVMKSYLRLFSRFADIVFYENVLSYLALIEATVNLNKVRYLSWFVDANVFAPKSDAEVPLADTFNVLFVGRVCEEKGIRFLLDAFDGLLRSVPAAKLTLVGQGPLSDFVEQAARHDPKRIQIVPRVKNSEMPQYYSAADVVCVPSITTGHWSEEFGTSIVQAMACAKPVVSTSSGGIPEKVIDGHTGILVPERDSAALCEALLNLSRNPLQGILMGQRARDRVVKRYDAQERVLYWETLLLNAVAER